MLYKIPNDINILCNFADKTVPFYICGHSRFCVLSDVSQTNGRTHFGCIHTFVVFINSSIGLIEANAIQFGMDQVLEASSTQLSQFNHWYFWFMHLGQQVVLSVVLVSLFVVSGVVHIQIKIKGKHLILKTITLLLTLFWVICLLLVVYLFIKKRNTCMLQKWELTHSKVCGKS